MIEVLQPGLLTTLQDFGRKGNEGYGIPPSGAFDPFLAAVANKLVDNPVSAGILEFALVGPTLRFLKDSRAAIVAFSCEYHVETEIAPQFSGFKISAGSILQFASMKGWFGYISVAGGFQNERVLGSISTYLPGRIGSRLERGMLLRTGEDISIQNFAIEQNHLKLPSDETVGILPAIHTSRFDEIERRRVTEEEYQVTIQSNRMGIRLIGTAINPPTVSRSTPVLPGTIQVPRSGQPIILGPDGPTTGGYAQIAVISRTSWTTLARTPPGAKIRFHWMDASAARWLYAERNSLLDNRSLWQEIKK